MNRRLIKCTIESVGRDEIAVTYDNGKVGIIPRKELSWSWGKKAHLTTLLTGQEIMAAPTGTKEADGRQILSITELYRDPWEEIKGKYDLEQIVEGRVFMVSDDGVHIQIEPGIFGYIPASSLGPSKNAQPRQLHHRGDIIQATIRNIHYEKRIVICDNKARLESLRQAQIENQQTVLDFFKAHCPTQEQRPYTTGPLRILIIDDNESLCKAMEKNFTLAGHSVDYEISPSRGIDVAIHNDYDIVIVDKIMPAMDGISVYRQIKKEREDTAVVIFTGESSIDPDEIKSQRNKTDL